MAVVTKTLKSSGGDYSSLITWESTEQTDLVADGDSHVLEADGFALEDETFDPEGWTTGASNNITFKAAAGHEHNGVSRARGGSGFRLRNSITQHPIFVRNGVHFVIEDLEFVLNSSSRRVIEALSGNVPMYARRCLFMKEASDAGEYIARVYNASGDYTFTDCVFAVLGSASSRGIYAGDGTHLFENCTINCTHTASIVGNANTTVINVAAFNSVTTEFSGSFHANSSNNASEDSSAPGSNPVTGLSITDGTDFTEPSTADYTPVASGALDGAGSNVNLPRDDIANVAHNDPPEIGAYALVAAANDPLRVFPLPKLAHPDFIVPGKKPVCPVEVDWDNTIAKGLTGFWLCDSERVTNLVTGGQWTAKVGTSLKSDRFGTHINAASEPDEVELDITNTGYLSCVGSFATEENSKTHRVMFGAVSGAGDGFEIALKDSTRQLWWATSNLFDINYTGDVLTDGVQYVVGIIHRPTDGLSVYLNNNLTATHATTTALTISTNNLTMFNRGDSLTQGGVGKFYWLAMWNRGISAAEYASFYADPYQILKPAVPLRYFTPAEIAAAALNNKRISSMHFQRHYEPVAIGS